MACYSDSGDTCATSDTSAITSIVHSIVLLCSTSYTGCSLQYHDDVITIDLPETTFELRVCIYFSAAI